MSRLVVPVGMVSCFCILSKAEAVGGFFTFPFSGSKVWTRQKWCYFSSVVAEFVFSEMMTNWFCCSFGSGWKKMQLLVWLQGAISRRAGYRAESESMGLSPYRQILGQWHARISNVAFTPGWMAETQLLSGRTCTISVVHVCSEVT